MIERIGRYRILEPLGEGGMGVVYTALDEALDRRVAVKTLRDPHSDSRSRDRFWREARAAARISHPHVCPIYEVGEDGGTLFLAMELLEGEPLSARLEGSPRLPLPEAGGIALAILSALEALHRAGVIHRDLKPSNVFLTSHGVKLLDFGLARHAHGGDADGATLTRTGMVIGTPRYMAPEQVTGQEPDARTDLFAVGAVLYEMLSGRPAFAGRTVAEVLHAVVYDHPPALAGSSAIAAVDRVVQRALSKSRNERPADAGAMASELRAAMVTSDTIEVTRARPMTRVIVMPLRVLRPDPETDFLAVGLADAVTGSLTGNPALVVRSSLAAARLAGDALDLPKLATEAQVDAVLTGTLLRAGDQVRVSVQLLEAPGGTVLWTQTTQAAFQDLFQLQDQLASRIVEALALPLGAGESARRDVPASSEAYQLFLRANQICLDARHWIQARDLYRQVVSLDPGYAPAWAQLGRSCRILAKYGDAGAAAEAVAEAERAFRRALELNPELSLAHTVYAHHESEMGRAREAMVRLIGRATARPAEPELLVGLCHALRYAGLLDASRAAHEKAMRLDPTALTSGSYTFYALGQLEKALEADLLGPRFNHSLALFDLGRVDEAKRTVAPLSDFEHTASRLFARLYCGAYDGDRALLEETAEQLLATGFLDPEGWYLAARSLIRVGAVERGLILAEGVLDKGYVAYRWMLRDPWLDPARGEPAFSRLVRAAEQRYGESRASYLAAGGERLLGSGTAA